MYLGAMTCVITIGGKYRLRGVHKVEIKKSVHQLIQTAKIELPLSAVMRNADQLQRIRLADKIKAGDTIKVEFGYNGNNRLEFEGYIKFRGDSMPMVLECEDELYLMRSVHYKKTFQNISLKTLIEYVLQQLEAEKGLKLAVYDNMPQLMFSKFIMKGANGIEVLQELKEHYGLSSYITTIGGKRTLYVGLAYSLEKGRANIVLGRNTIDKGDIKYQTDDDKNYKIKVVNFNRNGTKATYTFGNPNGDERTLHFYGDNDKAHLESMAKAEMEKVQSLGYKGKFKTFLVPLTEPGTLANVSDPQFEDRKSVHYVGTVTTTFDVSGGGRRDCEIDIKVNV
jgi:hypothetical protein